LIGGSPRADAIVRRFHLNTPIPYAIALFLLFVAWAVRPDPPPFDYTNVRFELELVGQSEVPASNLYRHHFSLVVENIGSTRLSEVPVELRARFDPEQPVRVESDFLGRRLIILTDQEPVPLVVILEDELDVSEKRRYSIDGIVTSAPPFNITYEVVAQDSDQVLASFSDLITGSGEDEDEAIIAALGQSSGQRGRAESTSGPGL
jgi:hypothetical protein